MKHYFYFRLLLIIFINFEFSYAGWWDWDDEEDDHGDHDHGDYDKDHYDYCGWKYGCFGYPENCVDHKSCSILVNFTQNKDNGDVNFHLTSSEMDNRYLYFN